MTRRISVVEGSDGNADRQLRWTGLVGIRQRRTFGREGDIPLATNPLDKKVSRQAVTVTAAERGWTVVPTNSNGVTLHPWAQPSRVISTIESIMWPRVGLRVVGAPELEHWILLEDDEAYTRGSGRYTTGLTDYAQPVLRLTTRQMEAVRVVFEDLLAWPPAPAPRVVLIKQAARTLDRSSSAVQERLIEVRRRAYELGLFRQDVELTDPEYVYALAHAGYVEPSPRDLHRPLRSGGRA
jgi:hypothetical protein